MRLSSLSLAPSPPGQLPLLSTRVPPFPSRPCPVPISKSKSIHPDPKPKPQIHVHSLRLPRSPHPHPHPCPPGTLGKHEQQTNTTQPFSLPVAPFPAFDWTGLDSDLDWHLLHSVLDTRRRITSTTPGTFLHCVSSHGEASPRTSKIKTKTKTKATSTSTRATATEPQPRPGRVRGPRRYHAPDHVLPSQTQTVAASFSPHPRYHGSLRSPPVHLDSYSYSYSHSYTTCSIPRPASVTSPSTYF